MFLLNCSYVSAEGLGELLSCAVGNGLDLGTGKGLLTRAYNKAKSDRLLALGDLLALVLVNEENPDIRKLRNMAI